MGWWESEEGPFKHFQGLKQQSVNIEHWLKSKLAWPMHVKSASVKWN